MNQPLVSVCIITYNQRQFIHETLSSVLEQDYENIEIVVADDGSTDGTVGIILDYARKYPDKIVQIVGGPNLGITGNSNRAYFACTGKYIAWMGGDDLMLPGKLRKQIEFMEANPGCVLSYHDLDVFQSNTGKTIRFFNSGRKGFYPWQGGVDKLVQYGTFCGACSVMTLRTACPSYGFDERIQVASDWLFWIETAINGKICFIPEVLGRYRRHAGNVTNKLKDSSEQLMTLGIIEAKYPEYAEYARRYRAKNINGIRARVRKLLKIFLSRFGLLNTWSFG
jgi:glycosyltransferase involved in cell wall biosynthesis